MVSGGIISRISRTVVTRCQGSSIFHGRPGNQNFIPILRNHFHSLHGSQDKHSAMLLPAWFTIYKSGVTGPMPAEFKGVAGQMASLHNPVINSYTFQRFGISSSASMKNSEKQTSQNEQETTDIRHDAKENLDAGSSGKPEGSNEKVGEESGSDEEELSMEDLVKLVAEKEGLLKTKHEEIEKMKDKVLRTYAEMENVMERTKREAENAKKFAIQNFAKSLLDVADNLGRASSVVKEGFAKMDTSQDCAGAVPLLKTLLEGVEMTEKQLAEVFKKFGVEKYDPTNEEFDPNRHNAVFQVPDSTKPPDSVAVVLKAGYMLHDRILRPAEVGVTIAADKEDANKGS